MPNAVLAVAELFEQDALVENRHEIFVSDALFEDEQGQQVLGLSEKLMRFPGLFKIGIDVGFVDRANRVGVRCLPREEDFARSRETFVLGNIAEEIDAVFARHDVVGDDETELVAGVGDFVEERLYGSGRFAFFDAEEFGEGAKVAQNGVQNFGLVVNADNIDFFHGSISAFVFLVLKE